ncbi:Dam family site-specific DNA-(adenine-N6)-methyltransferase [Clostridium sp. MCC353]|uniref:DNA adenine methylase n=1 Tax=Clostridium sp. MCC353 TaxID=2592646 RepID=UPI001C02B969|nr:Dam family site-specific DNA-(adenine-N6)-methyltransferase [Clostridium sp. MCC353]MBT9776290.1 Dam family site-specific DNA-(adenine-N6)-methyltransferase [Clostridium sp. MCC353]
MNPMLKYRGGKSKEIPYFIDKIPSGYDRYIEPFFGGGALYFYLEPKKAVINDVNTRLFSFYKEMKECYPQARGQLDEIQGIYEENQRQYEALKKEHPDDHIENKNEAFYYWMRDMFNHKTEAKYLDAVIYFFINKTAYSGMIRYNANGEFNVPFGRYKNLNTKLITDKHYELLGRTDIYNCDYSEIFNMARADDFIFLDPPYDCVFSDYGNETYKNGFGEEEHRRLANDFRNLPCKTLLVIGKTPLTEELYGSHIIDEYDKSYAVNIRNRFKTDAKHIVVTNY